MAYEAARIKDHPELQAFAFAHKRLEEDENKYLQELKEKVEKRRSEYDGRRKKIWTEMENFLIDKKLVRDNYKKEDNIRFDPDQGVLIVEPESEWKKNVAAERLMKIMPKELIDHLTGMGD